MIAGKPDDFTLLPSRRKRQEQTTDDDAETQLVEIDVQFTRTISTGSTDDAPDKTSGIEELIDLVGEGQIEYHT